MSRFVACTHDVYLGEPCAECAARLAGDDTGARLDLQRDTLLHQSARLDELYDQLRILEARIADQDAEIARLKTDNRVRLNEVLHHGAEIRRLSRQITTFGSVLVVQPTETSTV